MRRKVRPQPALRLHSCFCRSGTMQRARTKAVPSRCREDEAAALLVSDPSFRRQVEAACSADGVPVVAARPASRREASRHSSRSTRPAGPRPRVVDPATLGSSVRRPRFAVAAPPPIASPGRAALGRASHSSCTQRRLPFDLAACRTCRCLSAPSGARASSRLQGAVHAPRMPLPPCLEAAECCSRTLTQRVSGVLWMRRAPRSSFTTRGRPVACKRSLPMKAAPRPAGRQQQVQRRSMQCSCGQQGILPLTGQTLCRSSTKGARACRGALACEVRDGALAVRTDPAPCAPTSRYVLVHADTLQPPSESALRGARRQLGEPSDSRPVEDAEQPAPCSAARSRPAGPGAGPAAGEAALTVADPGGDGQAVSGLTESECISGGGQQAAWLMAQPSTGGGCAARGRRTSKRVAPSLPSDSEATESEGEPPAASRWAGALLAASCAQSFSSGNHALVLAFPRAATPAVLAFCSESDVVSSDDDFAVPPLRRPPRVGAQLREVAISSDCALRSLFACASPVCRLHSSLRSTLRVQAGPPSRLRQPCLWRALILVATAMRGQRGGRRMKKTLGCAQQPSHAAATG